MYTLFLILIVLAAVLMIAIVLIQESKGGGLASNFSSSNSIMGVRKTTDFVEKATWGLAISLVVFSVVCAYTAPQADGSQSGVHHVCPLDIHHTDSRGVPAEGYREAPQGSRAERADSCAGCISVDMERGAHRAVSLLLTTYRKT